MRVRRGKVRISLLIVIAAIGVGVLCSSNLERLQLAAEPGTGAPQLVSIQQLPSDGEMCAWPSTAPADPEGPAAVTIACSPRSQVLVDSSASMNAQPSDRARVRTGRLEIDFADEHELAELVDALEQVIPA